MTKQLLLKEGDRVKRVRDTEMWSMPPIGTTGRFQRYGFGTGLVVVSYDNWDGGWGDGSSMYGLPRADLRKLPDRKEGA